MPQVFGRYVQTVMARGALEAQQAGSATIEAEHLLLAIAAEREGTTQRLLDSVGLDRAAIDDALDKEFRKSLGTAGISLPEGGLPRPRKAISRPSKLGESAKLVFERGIAAVGDKKDLRPAHLLLGILELKVGTVPRALALTGADLTGLRSHTQESLPAGGG